MPLSMATVGDRLKVVKVSGKDDPRRFLENLGFVEGADISVVSQISGNLIVNVKETRVAIDRKMANRIMV